MMKKFMKKLWEKKDSKKGFTLVELIVVLVILAILAAITVPALLGWIDKAKEKQHVLEARSIYMGMQAQASEKYATDSTKAAITKDSFDIDELEEMAEVSGLEIVSVNVGEGNHGIYTITGCEITFTSGGDTITMIMADGTWKEKDEKSE